VLRLATDFFYLLTVMSAVALAAALIMCFLGFFIRKSRVFGSKVLASCSWLWAVHFWFWCLVVAYKGFGLVPLIIGLLFAGLGVIPIAFFYFLLQKDWMGFSNLLLVVIVIMGARLMAEDFLRNPDPKSDDSK
jgi:hypothetical protein